MLYGALVAKPLVNAVGSGAVLQLLFSDVGVALVMSTLKTQSSTAVGAFTLLGAILLTVIVFPPAVAVITANDVQSAGVDVPGTSESFVTFAGLAIVQPVGKVSVNEKLWTGPLKAGGVCDKVKISGTDCPGAMVAT